VSLKEKERDEKERDKKEKHKEGKDAGMVLNIINNVVGAQKGKRRIFIQGRLLYLPPADSKPTCETGPSK
jgi:hypothetical protein